MQLKLTKITCTISDRRCDPEFLQKLIDEGMNVARLNTAHIETTDADRVVANIRQVSDDRIGILVDTKGPEVRTLDIKEDISITAGDLLQISGKEQPEKGFKVNYPDFVNDVQIGDDILIDDGETKLTVTDKNENFLTVQAGNTGVIKNRKSVNVPGRELVNLAALTEKDERFVRWAAQNDIDFIAHSFVRNRADVESIQKILDEYNSPIQIIAKIENREGVDNLEEILDVAYGVMVARGDLGIEIPAQEVPIIQKRIIQQCRARLKPVITATQMLHTMIENPRPTRAEVSDVANAIYDGTDSIMLSGETAYGDYPVEAVRMMNTIARCVEAEKAGPMSEHLDVVQQDAELMQRNHLVKSAVKMASHLPAQAIVTATTSGDTARVCASYHSGTPIIALSSNPQVVRQLALSYGVHSELMDVPSGTDQLLKAAARTVLDSYGINADEPVVFVSGGRIDGKHKNFIQIEAPIHVLK
ncbi:MAG TPA: pyruvate kinase [Pontiella sp.]